MERRQWLQRTLASVVALVSAPASALMGAQEQSTGQGGGIAALHRAKSEWRKLLTPEQYNVLFEEETERPYSSPLDKEKRSGTYVCAACQISVGFPPLVVHISAAATAQDLVVRSRRPAVHVGAPGVRPFSAVRSSIG